MDEQQNAPPSLQTLIEQITQHIETQREYLSLAITEKVSAALGALAGILALCIIGLVALSYFGLAFAFWLGDIIGSRAGGFAVAGVVFIPIAVAAYYLLNPFVRKKIIQIMLEDETTENQNQS